MKQLTILLIDIEKDIALFKSWVYGLYLSMNVNNLIQVVLDFIYLVV